ncbi:uncharacterized protein BDR25DRAFT_360002 [Lindgomyces ingoldianus]|uniref:Uncharacterized protein n=1 Tax=Lindgomyces ingoldianus TaxID=673940 RepID=A0ACB6QIA4_9PLEO|nr:uncharacterized protein BDR25DRAFT_360002 [Lindgomyces ingoldianus]KAF2465847.1 hypothetical protein BDR25DRAFT_360002 [Lindgomyces ingoldianus]
MLGNEKKGEGEVMSSAWLAGSKMQHEASCIIGQCLYLSTYDDHLLRLFQVGYSFPTIRNAVSMQNALQNAFSAVFQPPCTYIIEIELLGHTRSRTFLGNCQYLIDLPWLKKLPAIVKIPYSFLYRVASLSCKLIAGGLDLGFHDRSTRALRNQLQPPWFSGLSTSYGVPKAKFYRITHCFINMRLLVVLNSILLKALTLSALNVSNLLGYTPAYTVSLENPRQGPEFINPQRALRVSLCNHVVKAREGVVDALYLAKIGYRKYGRVLRNFLARVLHLHILRVVEIETAAEDITGALEKARSCVNNWLEISKVRKSRVLYSQCFHCSSIANSTQATIINSRVGVQVLTITGSSKREALAETQPCYEHISKMFSMRMSPYLHLQVYLQNRTEGRATNHRSCTYHHSVEFYFATGHEIIPFQRSKALILAEICQLARTDIHTSKPAVPGSGHRWFCRVGFSSDLLRCTWKILAAAEESRFKDVLEALLPVHTLSTLNSSSIFNFTSRRSKCPTRQLPKTRTLNPNPAPWVPKDLEDFADLQRWPDTTAPEAFKVSGSVQMTHESNRWVPGSTPLISIKGFDMLSPDMESIILQDLSFNGRGFYVYISRGPYVIRELADPVVEKQPLRDIVEKNEHKHEKTFTYLYQMTDTEPTTLTVSETTDLKCSASFEVGGFAFAVEASFDRTNTKENSKSTTTEDSFTETTTINHESAFRYKTWQETTMTDELYGLDFALGSAVDKDGKKIGGIANAIWIEKNAIEELGNFSQTAKYRVVETAAKTKIWTSDSGGEGMLPIEPDGQNAGSRKKERKDTNRGEKNLDFLDTRVEDKEELQLELDTLLDPGLGTVVLWFCLFTLCNDLPTSPHYSPLPNCNGEYHDAFAVMLYAAEGHRGNLLGNSPLQYIQFLISIPITTSLGVLKAAIFVHESKR